ncbi:FAD-dependent monooxygenase [Amorphus sp. MBR-141]
MTNGMNVPVLVIGAGPTGLTLAIMLRRYGIDVRIIDRNAAPAEVSKALAVWSASLEVLSGMGVVDTFLASGTRLKALIAGDGARKLATLSVGEGIDSPYPYPLLLPQSVTEEILTDHLETLGTSIERGVELVGLDQDSEGVTATLKRPDGSEEVVRAAYLAGCDGARSFVRESLKIEFEGYTEPQMFILGDVKIKGGGSDGSDLDRSSIYIWWHGGSTVALFPFGAEVWRIFAARQDPSDDSTPTVEELQGHMDRHGPPGTRLSDPSWLSHFRTNERLAAKYRVGRIFLAGDAAHIHSPAGGQGMNTGIQDGFNLGWKLGHVLTGRGNAQILLDSYEPERRPVAHDVVAGAAQKLHAAFAPSRFATVARDVAATLIGHLPAAQKKLQMELSETAIVYREGPLVALGAPPRRPRRTDVGTRALDNDFIDATGGKRALWPLLSGTGHALLLFPRPGAPIDVSRVVAGVEEALTIVVLDDEHDPGSAARKRYRVDRAEWVLVRPDQVIAARGTPDELSALGAYVDAVIRPAAS